LSSKLNYIYKHPSWISESTSYTNCAHDYNYHLVHTTVHLALKFLRWKHLSPQDPVCMQPYWISVQHGTKL